MISMKTDKSPRTLWSATGKLARDSTGFNVQVVCDLVRMVAKSDSKSFRAVTVRFYLRRNCRTETHDFMREYITP
jgi:hypothetical protein